MRRSPERAQAHTAEIGIFLALAVGANVQLRCQIKATIYSTVGRTFVYFKSNMTRFIFALHHNIYYFTPPLLLVTACLFVILPFRQQLSEHSLEHSVLALQCPFWKIVITAHPNTLHCLHSYNVSQQACISSSLKSIKLHESLYFYLTPQIKHHGQRHPTHSKKVNCG